MSPIEYIAEGIHQGNWETVCEGYERLTGEALPLPTIKIKPDGAEHALQQITDIASSVLNNPTTKVGDIAAKPVKKKPGRPRNRSKKKTKEETIVTNDGEDSSLKLNDNKKTNVQQYIGKTQLITNDPDPEEIEKNKEKAKRAKKNKLQLKRKAVMTYAVKCNECEKSFQSNRPKGEMGQKCPSCLNSLKGIFS